MMTSSSDELFPHRHEAAVDINHLRVIRGKRPALHDFSVRLARGTITGLLGPSGCGKTTLIRSIVGTQRIESGSVQVFGLPAVSPSLRQRPRGVHPSERSSAVVSRCALRNERAANVRS